MKTFFLHTDGKVEETEMSYDDLETIAVSTHLGERCKYCGKEFKTIEDLNDTVWVGKHEHERLACEECWIQNQLADGYASLVGHHRKLLCLLLRQTRGNLWHIIFHIKWMIVNYWWLLKTRTKNS